MGLVDLPLRTSLSPSLPLLPPPTFLLPELVPKQEQVTTRVELEGIKTSKDRGNLLIDLPADV